MVLRVGVDTGGTFTDFVRVDGTGLSVHKVRTTPGDPTAAILQGFSAIAAGAPSAEVVHGSTVATNAVLERKGARVALVVTAGFEDVLTIGRQTRPELYNLFVQPRRPLIERGLTFGVAERLDADGAEIRSVDSSAVDRLAVDIDRSGAEAVAVCFLHAYANPAHEREVATSLRRAGFVVCASHEVLSEYREYERWSTTVLNAYLTPVVDRYLGQLERALGATWLSIMQSNGGSVSARSARSRAVRTVLSGPAAGVVGARAAASAAGLGRVISFDMGGTSTDVSLIEEGVATTTESTVGDFPVRLPSIDVHTVGAGGGSIARVDSGGALRVGPDSAGAQPGPVCYGVGDELTVTDANVLLGRLDPDYFLGGRMGLDVGRTRAVAADMARRLRLSVDGLAHGIIRVANAGMERAIRVVSIDRGHDPRRFGLVAFGGAGGMHACEIAAELSVATVLVPRLAGVLSALGMLVSDVTRDYSASVLAPSDRVTPGQLLRQCAQLVSRARRDLAAEGFRPARQSIDRQVDVRYVGQSYEISVPWSRDYVATFHRRHEHRYGYADVHRPTEVVALRVRASGLVDKPVLPYVRPRRRSAPAPAAVRAAWFDGRRLRTAFHHWDSLEPGMRGRGPAVITGGEATVVVPPRFDFRLDGFSNVMLTRGR